MTQSGSTASLNLKYRILLALIPVALMILVNPTGEFPLNDDWAYSLSVRHFQETGQLKLSTHPAMSLVFQVIYSAFFTKIFGFSFLNLRILTCIVALINNQIFFSIFSKLCKNPLIAFICALTIFLNPIYFSLTFTFMTEVHFLLWFSLSFWFILRAYETDGKPRYAFLVAASFLASLSFLIRQHGLLIPMSLALAQGILYLQHKDWRRFFLREIPSACALPVATYIIFNYWYANIHGATPAYQRKFDLLSQFGYVQFSLNLWASVTYLAWFIFPLLLIFLWKYIEESSRRNIVKFLIYSVVAIAFCIWWQDAMPVFRGEFSPIARSYRDRMPYISNILFDLGLGPITLRNVFNTRVPPPHPAPIWFWSAFTWFAWVSLTIMMFIFYKVIRERHIIFRAIPLFSFILLTALIALEIIISPKKDGGLFDRHLLNYFIPAITLVLCVLEGVQIKKAVVAILAIYLLVVSLFDVAATHDYLAWNRARWEGIDYLRNEVKAKPFEIDGGFEYNGWYLSDTFEPQGNKYEYLGTWWVVSDKYRIFFDGLPESQEDAYVAIKEIPYNSWMALGQRIITVARQNEY